MKPRRFASATTFSISWSRGTVKLAPYSPPGEPAARAGRPPHTVGRRNANSMLPTRRARCAGWPTSPHGGEAKCKLDTPHPASPLRGLADLPTRWGGEMQARCSPPGEPAARAGRPPHTVGRRMQARYSPPGEPAARAGRPPHTVGRRNANSILPTRRARCAGWPTSPHGGEAKCKLDTPHPASPLRGLADLPTRWGGEMQTRYSPPGEPASRAGRPPHTVGRRNANSILPTRRARCAGWPPSPHGGEAKCKLDTPHPARPLRGRADLPTWWGGEMQTRYSPPGEPAARAGRPRHTVGRRNASSMLPTRRARCAGWPTSPHGGEAKCKLDTPLPASPLRGLADLPTRWGGGEMQARYSPPGEPAARAGRPPHT